MTASHDYFRTRLPEDARRSQTWRHLSRYLARWVPPEGTVLELGAGYCYFSNEIAAGRRVAVDVADVVVRAAGPGVEAVQEDAAAFLARQSPETFHFILASNFFEHLTWDELGPLLRSLRRALKPGGVLAVIQPNFRLCPKRYFDDYTHRTIFTDVSLRDWLESGGFTVRTLVPRFLPLTVKSAAGHLSFLVPLYLHLPWRPFAGQMFALAERA